MLLIITSAILIFIVNKQVAALIIIHITQV